MLRDHEVFSDRLECMRRIPWLGTLFLRCEKHSFCSSCAIRLGRKKLETAIGRRYRQYFGICHRASWIGGSELEFADQAALDRDQFVENLLAHIADESAARMYSRRCVRFRSIPSSASALAGVSRES